MTPKNYKAGVFTRQYGYRSFTPNKLNQQWIVENPAINSMLEEANYQLGQLNAFSCFVPDVDLFIRMHIIKEATQSSRIEGIRTNIDEALLEEKNILPENKDDWQEVQDYIAAMNYSISRLKKLPLSSRLIREAHKILLKGVRGKYKLPGEFRSSQNWIGGATLNDATFIPPHHTLIADLIGDLEKFLNNDEIKVPHLIRIGMAHYQFEAIHPFLDGNGRMGRLLITLYLVSHGILTQPTLYLSDFIEKHRSNYYDNLIKVSEKNNMEQWLKFFLTGVIETAKTAISTLNQIISLQNRLGKDTITSLGKRIPNARALLQYLYKQPIVTVSDIMVNLDITKPTANTLVKDFTALQILKEQTGFRRNRVFVFSDYLDLFNR